MPDPMTKEQRAELRKLAEAATAGPWTATKDFKRYWIECAGQKICGGNAIGEISNDDTDADEAAANAGHVAAANPTVLLSLLDTLDAAEAEAGRLREDVQQAELAELRRRYGSQTSGRMLVPLPAGYEWRSHYEVDDLNGDALAATGEEVPSKYTYDVWTVCIAKEAARAAQGTSDAGKGEGR